MQFDLKQAEVFFIDGFTDTGLVNLLGFFPIGATTITIDGYTGVVNNSDTFTIAGNAQVYTVSAHSETLGNTTSVTFTPALVANANDNVAVTLTGGGAFINKPGTYVADTTTIVVDGITGIIPEASTFFVGSDPVVHNVVSTIETLGNTTSLTFTPGLSVAIFDNETITFSGRRLLLKIGDGNCSYDEKRAIEYKKDRGKLDTVRLGDEEPIDVKFDLRWEFLKSEAGDPTSIPSVEEVLKKIGAAVDWVSSSADPCEPYAIDILVVFTPPCIAIDPEQILLHDFRYEQLSHDFKQGMISCTGKCNRIVAEVTRD